MKPFHTQFFVDGCQAHCLVKVHSYGFDGFVKIEDKTIKSMIESLPLHGGFLCNACHGRIIDLKFVTLR
jgi:hypothetical protein